MTNITERQKTMAFKETLMAEKSYKETEKEDHCYYTNANYFYGCKIMITILGLLEEYEAWKESVR